MIDKLSADELKCIIEFCDIPTTLALESTCTTLQQLTSHNSHWEVLLSSTEGKLTIMQIAYHYFTELHSHQDQRAFHLPDFNQPDDHSLPQPDGNERITQLKQYMKEISSKNSGALNNIREKYKANWICWFMTIYTVITGLLLIITSVSYGIYLDKFSGSYMWLIPVLSMLLLLIGSMLSCCVFLASIVGYVPVVSEIVYVFLNHKNNNNNNNNGETTTSVSTIRLLFGNFHRTETLAYFAWLFYHQLIWLTMFISLMGIKQISTPGRPYWTYFMIPIYPCLLLICINTIFLHYRRVKSTTQHSHVRDAILLMTWSLIDIICYMLIALIIGLFAAKLDGRLTRVSWIRVFSPMYVLIGFLLCSIPHEYTIFQLFRNVTMVADGASFCCYTCCLLLCTLIPIFTTILLFSLKMNGKYSKLNHSPSSYFLLPLHYLIIEFIIVGVVLAILSALLIHVVRGMSLNRGRRVFSDVINESPWFQNVDLPPTFRNFNNSYF